MHVAVQELAAPSLSHSPPTAGQLVLYDFDQAQIDGYPIGTVSKRTHLPNWRVVANGGKYGGLNLVGRALGAVLQDLGRSASVGYDEVINN